MTDKELLELAAKAAGLDVYIDVDGKSCLRETCQVWNPLKDDGDALRLAVKFGMRECFIIEIQKTCLQATAFEPFEHCEYEEFKEQGPYAATRRAIVRAAAEIGKTL